MKIIYKYIFLILTLTPLLWRGIGGEVYAQPNLVPNWSFEIDSLCPDNGSEIYYAPPWHSAGGNPDYFNACAGSATNTMGVPVNHCGEQYAKTGVAYAGIFCYHPSPSPIEQKEYLQVKLTDSLIFNRKYCISFYVNLATSLAQAYHNVAITEMGMYISDTAVFRNDQLTLPFIPQIKSPVGVFLNDTLNWTEISGTYIAHGGEKYITIGNFNNPTDTFNMPNNNNNTTVVSYYFVDDVTVRDCTNDGVEEMGEGSIEVYPNPATNMLTIEVLKNTITNSQLEITNVLGQLIYCAPIITTTSSIDLSNYPSGVYILSLKNDKKIFCKKFAKK